jgi:hypothetical protein
MAPPFFASALDGGEWSASRPDRFTPGTHWGVGWVSPRLGLDWNVVPKLVIPARSPLGKQYLLSSPRTERRKDVRLLNSLYK